MRRNAFTLVELIVVVVVLVILLAVALPAIKYGMDASRIREGARQVNTFFASARAQAAATGQPAGVWLELERIGDPAAATGLYQCSQLYLAEVPPPYAGDIQNARAYVTGNAAPWQINFAPASSAASLVNLVADGEIFRIKFDYKGHSFLARRSGNGYEVIDAAHVPPQSNGTAGYAFQIYRQPQRAGRPLDLPQGVVIDASYSGAGPSGNEFAAARGRVLVMFSPQGGVASVSFFDQAGNLVEDTGTSKLYFLVGRAGQVDYAWQKLPASNLADGGNFWIAVNRRNGSVATVENVPNANLPFTTPAERAAYLTAAREFAAAGDVKGGQ